MLERCRLSLIFVSLFVCLNAAEVGKGWEDVFGNSPSSTLPVHKVGNKSYVVVTNIKLKFLQAMDFCENMHMNLVTIESPEENKAIEKLITDANSGNEYWTAGTRFLDGKTWGWFTTGDVIQYTAWKSGEPSGGDEQCLITIKSNEGLQWNDVTCDREYPIICERPIDEKREDLFANEEKDWKNILNVHKNKPNLDLLHVNGKDFYISQEYRGNYFEALDYCQVHNMRLASIESKEENDRLYRHIRDISAGTEFWSAGTRLLDGRNWVWLPKGLPVSYTNWGPGQPDNLNDRCIRLNFDKNNGLFWDDINCNNANRVICERSTAGNGDDGESLVHDDDAAHNGNGNNGANEGNGGENEGNNGKGEHEGNGGKGENGGNGEKGENGANNGQGGNGAGSENIGEDDFLSKLSQTVPGNIPTVLQEGRKFYVSRDLLATPSQARTFCAYHKLKLADINNSEENLIISKIVPYPVVNGPFWLDGEKSKDKWVWKQSDKPIEYFNWAIGVQHSDAKSCLGVSTLGKYDTESCNKKKPFICESASDENITGKDNGDAIINVFMSNNLITKNGKTTHAKELISSQFIELKPEGGYHITVDNNAGKC